jgi:putative aldouronate transport system permease protein
MVDATTALKQKRVRSSKEDRTFYTVDVILLTLAFFVVLYPLVFILSSSFSDPYAVLAGEVWLFPVRPTLEGYRAVLAYNDVWMGYGNTIFYAVVGTSVNVVLTMMVAYPLSRKDFVGRNPLMFLFTFTMFFSGGLIPLYLLVRNLGILNTRAAMILPTAIGVWNVIITRTFLQFTIPGELYDSARIDGASNTRILLSVVVPLSGPVIAVITLFYAVAHWNSFFPALIYLRSRSLLPLQMILREILIMFQPRMLDEVMQTMDEAALEAMTRREFLQALLQYALIVIATLPVLIIYPFVQKYFVRGVMIGAIKG